MVDNLGSFGLFVVPDGQFWYRLVLFGLTGTAGVALRNKPLLEGRQMSHNQFSSCFESLSAVEVFFARDRPL